MDIDWKSDLEEWLAPFFGALRETRRDRVYAQPMWRD